MKKIEVTSAAPIKLMKSTSYNGNTQDTKVTFQPEERVQASFVEVWNSQGYQAHLAAKDRRIEVANQEYKWGDMGHREQEDKEY